MYKKLLSIYQDRMIEPMAGQYPDGYYYFFNEDGKLFGIDKGISHNEYLLLKSMYLEKTFHYNDSKIQKIYEYILEKGDYPFSKSKAKFLVYHTLQPAEQDNLNSLLNDLFKNVEIICYMNSSLVFYFDQFDVEIEPIFRAISEDFGVQFRIHEGIFITSETEGKAINQYLKAYQNSKIFNQDYSNVIDLLFALNEADFFETVQFIRRNLLGKILEKDENLEILQTFFKNDLNVSKSAKALYMHRNSLINKLDIISKEIGLNIQQFRVASAIQVLLSYVYNKY